MPDDTPDGSGFFLDEYDGPRFWKHVSFSGGRPYLSDPLARLDADSGECWPWSGKNTGGTHPYGQILIHGKFAQAHAVAYRDFGGTFSEGLVMDHLCRNTRCVRPSHVEPVSFAENLHRGKLGEPGDQCAHGHDFTPENTRVRERNGKRSRECRTCSRAFGRARMARRRAV